MMVDTDFGLLSYCVFCDSGDLSAEHTSVVVYGEGCLRERPLGGDMVIEL
jgi:hypothetical protein